MPNHDEVIGSVLWSLGMDASIDVSKLIGTIQSADNPATVISELQSANPGIMEVLLNKDADVSEEDLIKFVRQYAQYLDLNAATSDNQTVLHHIATKDFPELSAVVLDPKFKFATKLGFHNKDTAGHKPVDLAGDKTKKLYTAAAQADFTRQIVLVHPFQPNSILNCLYYVKKDHLVVFDERTGSYDLPKTMVNAMLYDDTMLTNDAVLGSHLSFNTHQYTDSFVDRPHIHWWWNGLFQANSGGDWEHSLVAFLEPLDSVENVIGCAPYDTMTIGPHRLSNDSCIIVPDGCVAELQKRLKDYRGKIIGFDPSKETLRAAINRIMPKQFPHACQLTDSAGADINQVAMSDGASKFNRVLAEKTSYRCSAGYFERIFVRARDQQSLIPLMQNERTLLMPEFTRYAAGRYVGLHSHAVTDVESNRLIKILRTVSCSPAKISEYKQHFIGTSPVEKVKELCVLEAFKIYDQLMKYAPETGAHEYADYIFKKALISDFRSTSGAKGIPNRELKRLIDENFDKILLVVSKLSIVSELSLTNNENRTSVQQRMNGYLDCLKSLLDSVCVLSSSPHRFIATQELECKASAGCGAAAPKPL